MTKKELCKKLAEDYADRVARVGRSYDDAYNHYFKRCLMRKDKDLQQQYDQQGLGNLDSFIV